MIDEKYPIYDNEVVSVFGLRQPYNKKDANQKLEVYLEQLEYIRSCYNEVVNNKLLINTIKIFDKRFSSYNVDVYKKLDYIFWSVGKLKMFES